MPEKVRRSTTGPTFLEKIPGVAPLAKYSVSKNGTIVIILFHNFTLIFNYFSPARNKPVDDPVPIKFVQMVKCCLAKMAGAGYLDPDLIDREFWRWFPKKMNNSKTYQKKKKVVTSKIFSFF